MADLELVPNEGGQDWIPVKIRAYIYRLLVSVAPVAMFYGIGSGAEWALWIAFGTSVLGNGLATVYTSREG
jgi:hypothetical protein